MQVSKIVWYSLDEIDFDNQSKVKDMNIMQAKTGCIKKFIAYEDLKDKFDFKSQHGKSSFTFTAIKTSDVLWNITRSDVHTESSDWHYDNILIALNNGNWVIQCDNQFEEIPSVQEQTQDVITIRDEFAMVALQRWIAYSPCDPKNNGRPVRGNTTDITDLAKIAYMYADAMMTARKESL